MKNKIKTTKGKRALSVLLALVMVLSVASPAFSQILGVTAKAASKFEVELDFQNLFLFEKWANNTTSTTVLVDGDASTKGDGVDDLETDIANGSFILNKTSTDAAEVYTAYSSDSTNAATNQNYYTVSVKPDTTYKFSYNLTMENSANAEFRPYVFMFDSEGLYERMYLTPAAVEDGGENSFTFTTGSDTSFIQFRFGIAVSDVTKTAKATVNNIKLYRIEVEKDTENLFSFSDWSSSASNGKYEGLDDGTVSVPENTETIVMKADTSNTNNSGELFTNFNTASNEGFYSISVKENTSYTLSYNLESDITKHPLVFQPWVVYMKDGTTTLATGRYYTPGDGDNNFTFTTPAGTTSIQISFNLSHINENYTCTISDIGIYESEVTEHITDPYRQYYPKDTYSTYGEVFSGGTLPTPAPIPDGMVFAGWYTGENGAGDYISADTEIHYESLTVYPKFEPEVDSLVIKTDPTKMTYTNGEKFNPSGMVLTATRTYTVDVVDENGTVAGTETKTETFDITSGYRWSPEYLTSTGKQTITVSYGGKTDTLYVTVNAYDGKNITVNDESVVAQVANNVYTFDYTGDTFNRYEMTYYSDSYVKGTITFTDGVSEDFFLEPSASGSFASYIDGFVEKDESGNLTSATQSDITSIKFTCLNKEYGNFELYSLTTIKVATLTDSIAYYNNEEYQVGIDLAYGGVVSELYDLKNKPVAILTDGATKVDYEAVLESNYEVSIDNLGDTDKSTKVNLINIHDRGRYLQQSYYGTDQPPFELGSYNGNPWKYNPVQGGNIAKESSKVIDYRITEDQIYVKTRPLDWGKSSDGWPDSYNTPSYMEAWYVFEDGMIKTYCRFVDYSGYPSNYTDQELPALYTIEPLNHLVYYGNKNSEEDVTNNNLGLSLNEEDNLEFWGVSTEYNAFHAVEGNNEANYTTYPLDNDRYCSENWAAFTASSDKNSFGIGVYSAGVTDFTVGSFPTIYKETVDANNVVTGQTKDLNNRHTTTLDPATEDPTSYIAPIDQMTFESYKPYEYSYYITTGTADQIRDDFNSISDREAVSSFADAKIAVPETAYLDPTNYTTGQYYVNNVLDETNYNTVVTEAKSSEGMYLGFSAADAGSFTVKVSNVGTKGGTVSLVDSSTSTNTSITLSATSNEYSYTSTTMVNGVEEKTTTTLTVGTAISSNEYTLKLSEALSPGETTTVKWEITTNTGETYIAYTVMYAPERTVGAVAEARQVESSQNEISSWITGVNGVDHSQSSPLGSFHGDYSNSGYFKEDPLAYTTPLTNITSTGESADDLINVATTDNEKYVMQTATNGHDSSRAQSYLGLLTVDGSRYTNTNQIPNLVIGYDALRRGNWDKDTFHTYTNYYALGTSNSFTGTDLDAVPTSSEWIQERYFENFAADHDIPERYTVVPEYDVSDIDGKYIHALNRSQCIQDFTAYIARRYATAGTSVLCNVTDKGDLRDAVLEGYSKVEGNYASSEYDTFIDELEDAAIVLGDPSATQEEIDAATKEIDSALDKLTSPYFALKYDNLFSALEFSQHTGSMTMNVTSNASISYNDGTLTVISDNAEKADIYAKEGTTTDYYNVDVEKSTEYVFEYDVETISGSQLLLFFYKEDGTQSAATNQTMQINSGSITNLTSTPHVAAYVKQTGHVVIRFTTPADVDRIGIRFGNTNAVTNESTFSNIRLIDSEHYYEDATYPKTESAYEEHQSYGTLPVPTREGTNFHSWNTKPDGTGTTVTGADIALEHKTIYSIWGDGTYTIKYNLKGGTGSIASHENIKYSDSVTLSDGTGITREGYKLIGWSIDSVADTAEYTKGQTVSKLSATNGDTVTLYAVWKSDTIYEVAYDNLFIFSDWAKSSCNKLETQIIDNVRQVSDVGITTDTENGTITIYNDEDTATYARTSYWVNLSSAYMVPIEPSTEYVVEYTSTSNDGGKPNVCIYFQDTSKGYLSHIETSSTSAKYATGTQTVTVESGESAAYIILRFDNVTNGSTLTYSDIAIYKASEADKIQSIENREYRDTNADELYTPVRPGYTFEGWYVDADTDGIIDDTEVLFDSSTHSLSASSYVLLSSWSECSTNVTFDNLIDLSAWKKKNDPGNATATYTDTAITLTSNEGVGEGTFESPYFEVTPGADYKIEMDFIGDGWDVYIFFCDANGSWVDFNDGTNRFSSDGAGVSSRVFTAPDKDTVVKAKIRLDANGANNTVTFNNIRVYEDTGINVSPVNKYVGYNAEYENLPEPTKTGYEFIGWNTAADGSGSWVENSDKMTSKETVNLYSQWEVINYTVYFSANGPDVTIAEQNVNVTQNITLPDSDALSWENAEFLGWSYNQYSTTADYAPGATITVESLINGASIGDEEQLTLYAVWEITGNCFNADTILVDFSLPITFNPLENDSGILGYHGLDAGFGTTFEYGFDTSYTDTYTVENRGVFKFNKSAEDISKYYITFTPAAPSDTETVINKEFTIYYYGKLSYSDGTYKEFNNTITIVPASNVYYEEDMLVITESDNLDWTSNGTATGSVQSASGSDDIYGYDKAYDNTNTFSNNTYLQANVTTSNKKSDTASFTFTGTGFDLIGACGKNTGVQMVKVKQLVDGSWKTIKLFIVDTYYNGDLVGDDGLVHQVPILSYRVNGNAGTYMVETTATYLNSSTAVKNGTAYFSLGNGETSTVSNEPSEKLLKELEELGFDDLDKDIEVIWMDDNSIFNGGMGSPNASVLSGSVSQYFSTTGSTAGLTNYVDGFRIYKNGGVDNYIEAEKNPTYYNIVDGIGGNILTEGKFTAYTETDIANIFGSGFDYAAYVDGDSPMGEIYLGQNQAVAFTFNAKHAGTTAAVMLGMRVVSGSVNAKVTATLNGVTKTTNPNVISATEMYYTVSPTITVSGDTGEVTMIIVNTGTGTLAVNNLKLVNGSLENSATLDDGTLSGSADAIGGTSSVPTPVVPTVDASDAVQDDANADTTTPETDVEDSVKENDFAFEIDGVPAPIASFLEMLFKFLAQLVGSFGF